MKVFIKTKKYGTLYIEKIIFESYFPIIFTCVNELNQLFFVVCSKNNKEGCKWLIGKTEAENIIQLLKNQISVRDILLHSTDRLSVDYINNEYIINDSDEDFSENSIYLPKIDSVLDAEDGEFDEEIEYYSTKVKCEYKPELYTNLINSVDTINNENGTIIEELNTLKIQLEKTIVHSEILNELIDQEINDMYFPAFLSNVLEKKYESLKANFDRTMINDDETYSNFNFFDDKNYAA